MLNFIAGLTLGIRAIGLSYFQYISTTETINRGHLAKLTDCEYFKQDHTVAPPEQEQEEIKTDMKCTYACASVACVFVRELSLLMF